MIKQCFTNGTVKLQFGAIEVTHNIRPINPYKSDKNVEYINPKDMCDLSKYEEPVIYFCLNIKSWIKIN